MPREGTYNHFSTPSTSSHLVGCSVVFSGVDPANRHLSSLQDSPPSSFLLLPHLIPILVIPIVSHTLRESMATSNALFAPLPLGGGAGPISLAHRIVLAPLTRNRAAEPSLAPHASAVE